MPRGRRLQRRGRLIVVEGIDGSGKSTQIKLLHKWLEARGHQVVFTEWNSSDLVRQATKRGKKKNLLTPTTFSLLHATDFADRLTYRIVPYLKRSEEHTSELQSLAYLVCRLLLEK